MHRLSKLKSRIVNIIPLAKCDSTSVFQALKLFDPVFIWESSNTQETRSSFSFHTSGRFAYIGFSPAAKLVIHNHKAHWQYDGQETIEKLSPTVDPLQYAAQHFGNLFSLEALQENAPESAFVGGLAGIVSYDTARYFERLKLARGHSNEPDCVFYFVDKVVILDKLRQTASVLVWHSETSESLAAAQALVDLVCEAISVHNITTQESRHLKPADIVPKARFAKSEFMQLVERAKEYIRAGDIFQVVLSNSFAIPQRPDPLALYHSLRNSNPSPYHHLFRSGEIHYVGASPEAMLRGYSKEGQLNVFMRPVAGTFPRAADPHQDRENARLLQESEKERAEHVMLVDLERNDIGRVAVAGSVSVTDLLSVESYSHVHHLVSQVGGTLARGNNYFSALRSCFPIGTLAGTPKIRAMEIIAELEAEPRGFFGGCCVLADALGNFDSCVAIRGAVIDTSSLVMKTGAGIVYDSNPEREFEECLWKCNAMHTALRHLLP